MEAMGTLPGTKDDFGHDATGIIRSVGGDVHHVKVGDRVMLMGHSLLATRQNVCGSYVVKLPSGVEIDKAASIPAVFCTAIHCIINLGKLKKGQVRYQ